MFRDLSSQITAAVVGKDKEKKKVMPPTLRSDIYAVIDKAKAWISGTRGQPGDGVSYGTILTTIQKYFPELTLGLELVGHVESEVATIVGGITNMIMEYSMWESMSGGMATRTWVDGLIGAYEKATLRQKNGFLAKGITQGINHYADVNLMTKDFTTRIQMISALKSISTKIYGVGTDEARHGEAVWNSKFI